MRAAVSRLTLLFGLSKTSQATPSPSMSSVSAACSVSTMSVSQTGREPADRQYFCRFLASSRFRISCTGVPCFTSTGTFQYSSENGNS